MPGTFDFRGKAFEGIACRDRLVYDQVKFLAMRAPHDYCARCILQVPGQSLDLFWRCRFRVAWARQCEDTLIRLNSDSDFWDKRTEGSAAIRLQLSNGRPDLRISINLPLERHESFMESGILLQAFLCCTLHTLKQRMHFVFVNHTV
jgi:hypothetical protein